MIWAAVLATSAGCYLLKLAGLSVPARVLASPRVRDRGPAHADRPARCPDGRPDVRARAARGGRRARRGAGVRGRALCCCGHRSSSSSSAQPAWPACSGRSAEGAAADGQAPAEVPVLAERPPGPVDDAYAQTRWLRPYRPGVVRVATSLLLLATLGLVLQVSLLTTFRAPTTADTLVRLAITVVLLVVLGTVFSRCYLAGVWVTDHRVRVLRPLSTRSWAWSEIADVRSVAGPTRVLGTPLALPGHAVVLVLADGFRRRHPGVRPVAGLLGRPEAYDMAAGAVEGWFEAATRRPPRTHT